MKPARLRAFESLQIGPVWQPRPQAFADPLLQQASLADAQPLAADAGSAVAIVPANVPAMAAAADVTASNVTAAAAADADVAAAGVPPATDRRAAIALMDWARLAEQVAGCRDCGLCQTRSRTVFGVGSHNARWMLIGEAPGAEEDQRGEPFVGKAGRLLDQMLSSIGLDRRQDVFIANVLKCRPPGNRDPQPQEVASCEPYLMRQLQLVDPAIVVLLGRFAAQSMLGSDASIASLRGRLHRIRVGDRQVPAVVTYHPAYLLRNPVDKGKVWRDLLLARQSVVGPPA